MTQDGASVTVESHNQTLISVLCTEDDWTPNENTQYASLSFRKDGIGCLKLLNDQPGVLLVCEFDWTLDTYNPCDASANTLVDVQYKSLADSLRTRQVAHFTLEMKIRRSKPRAEFGDFGDQDLEGALARRLAEEVFEEEEYFSVDLETGNFAPDHDTNDPKGAAFGRTRWGMRLSFRNESPVPSLGKWKEGFHGMVDAQNWGALTKWYCGRLPES